jgi:subtilisin family serine protease
MVALAWCLAAGPVVGDRSARAGDDPGAGGAAQVAVEPSALAGMTGSIAVKLAPGSFLAEKSDGTLTVVQKWGALATAAEAAPGLPLTETDRLDGLGIRVLEPAPAPFCTSGPCTDLEEVARVLRLMPGVQWAETSLPVYACLVPNDPLYPAGSYTALGQWSLPRLGFPRAWDITTGSAEVIVAVIDTGIDQTIADFSGRIVSPYSVLRDSSVWPTWLDDHGHGSAVAAVAAARGNDLQGMAGAAWNVKIMPVKISDAGESTTTLLAEGIEYAVDNGADVINVSFSGPNSSHALNDAVDYATAAGVVIVAAAGNDAGPVGYPAAIAGVIAVGATDRADKKWSSSNGGDDLDVVAPGVDIISYLINSPSLFAYYAGTSLSAPLVAGAAALILSVDPDLTPGQVTDIIRDSAKDLGSAGWDETFGWGLVDVGEAVTEAAGGGTSTTTTTVPPTTTTTVPPSTTTTTTPSTTTTTTEARFVDVSEETTPYSTEIGYLASLGIVEGFEGGHFYPEDGLKRQQFAKTIVLALDYPVTQSDMCPFTDVEHLPDELYPYHYVAVAYQRGITEGSETPGLFAPYRTLTRAQMITMVTRGAQLPEPPAEYTPPFSNFSAVHFPFARKAAYAGLLNRLVGMGPFYDFKAPATRGEVCALLYTLLQ